MNYAVQDQLQKRLLDALRADGSWGYVADGPGAAEPTALAALALLGRDHATQSEHALNWLAAAQHADGGVPIYPKMDAPCWPTGPACLAWRHSGIAEFSDNAARGERWIIHSHGKKAEFDEGLLDHDATIDGWSWVAGTHSWLEPTACAVIALKAAGRADHPRTRDGVRLILDRVLPGGGWNYGNRRVMGHTLLPFPATTGVALAALDGEPACAAIRQSIDYLRSALSTIHAPLSLGWGLLGLAAHNARPDDANDWITVSADRARKRAGPIGAALLLLASRGERLARAPEAVHA